MRLLHLTPGTGSFHCGSCLRDNALAAELKARGHDVLLVPLYTPTLTDEPNVSEARVAFGGISVYLQQQSAIFRKLPRLLDRLLWKLHRPPKAPVRVAATGDVEPAGVIGRALLAAGRRSR